MLKSCQPPTDESAVAVMGQRVHRLEASGQLGGSVGDPPCRRYPSPRLR